MARKVSERFGVERLRAGLTRSRTFDIGLLIPTSGSLGLLGPSAYACARLARDAWNARGGLDGREVRLNVIDSSESSPTLVQELDQMLRGNEVNALVALCNTAMCRRISQVVDRRAPLVYTPHYEGQGLPDWVHAIGETPQRQLLPALDWLQRRHQLRRWFLVGNDYSWPRHAHDLARPHLQAHGAQVVGECYVPLGERRFDGIVERVRAARADALMVSLVGGESVYLARALGNAGLAGKVVRLSVCTEENAVLAMGAENTEGLYMAAGYFASLDSDANGDFKERYYGCFGDRAPTLNSLSQSVYEGIVHLQDQACKALNRDDGTRLPGVRDARRRASDASQDPIYIGTADGLKVRVIQPLAAVPG